MRAGFDVVVDTVFERRDCFDSARRAFAATPHFYVAVTCPLDDLQRREQSRGNRPPGLARRQHVEVFYDVPYTLELDAACSTGLVVQRRADREKRSTRQAGAGQPASSS
jgi:chloramphenicol 3-O phosphotransferase